MVKYPTILDLPQADINRQLYEMIVKLQKSQGADATAAATLKDRVDDIEDEIGADDKATTIKGRIKALETAGK